MTREELLKQWPGMSEAEKNCTVAEIVFGWKAWIKDGRGYATNPAEADSVAPLSLFRWSLLIETAFRVVDKMRDRYWMLTLMNWRYYERDYYTAKFRNSDLVNKEWEAEAPEAPDAICLAACLALCDE